MKKYKGLTSQEVIKSRMNNGDNRLTEIETESFWQKLVGNLEDPIIRILLFALVITLILAFMAVGSWIESIGIAIAVTLATGIGAWLESKSESGFQELQAEASKIKCKVWRDGAVAEVMIDDIVWGDHVILQAGDMIPADGWLLDGEITLNQAAINGESEDIVKMALPKVGGVDYTDTTNVFTLYRGTVVTSGESVMHVGRVGAKTMYGQTIAELNVEEVISPLKQKLQVLADIISKFGFAFGASIFVAMMFQNIFINNGFDGYEIMNYLTDFYTLGTDILNAFIAGIVVIVVAVPEGLPLMITMVLSLNMRKMQKAGVLVRKMIGIETAGNMNILFSDKTGTLTKGELEVIVAIDGEGNHFNSYNELSEEFKKEISTSILTNTSASIVDGKSIGGNATDRALLAYGNVDDANNLKVIEKIPFSSKKKMVIAKTENCSYITGAAEVILNQCSEYYNSNGDICELDEAKYEMLDKKINELANKSIRVIVLAISTRGIDNNELKNNFRLISILGIRDDVRPEAITAVSDMRDAGVQVVMVTGDKKETAEAIAKELKLVESTTDIVITSQELNGMSDDEIKEIMLDLRVVARCLPSDKSRLVRLAQEMNLVAACSGDGVNDAPALKKADVGFAMGITGTAVAQEAADIILTDDNFASIANAVLYGRTIYRSIQKFITFQLTLNVAACLIVFLAPLFGMTAPLTIIQMLWVNIVMDSLGALAFGSEPALKKYMKEKPKSRDEKIVTKDMLVTVLTSGLSLTGLGLFFLSSDAVLASFSNEAARYTAFFVFFILFAVVNGFHIRTENTNIFDGLKQNPTFLKVMGLIAVVQITMTYIGGDVLRTVPLTINELIIAFGMALLALPIGFIIKKILRNK